MTGLKSPIGLALASGDLWVADLDSKAINRVDTRTARVVSRLDVGGSRFESPPVWGQLGP